MVFVSGGGVRQLWDDFTDRKHVDSGRTLAFDLWPKARLRSCSRLLPVANRKLFPSCACCRNGARVPGSRAQRASVAQPSGKAR